MGLGGHAGHGIFDEDDLVAAVEGCAGGGFDAEVGGDAAEEDGVDAAAAELLIEVGGVEGSPLPLGDEEIAGLKTGFGGDVGGVGRRGGALGSRGGLSAGRLRISFILTWT